MADVKVNKQQWDALSAGEQTKITAGLVTTGALKAGDQIVGSADAEAFDAQTKFEPMWNPLGDICKALCDTAAAAGATWCIANTAGLGLPVCLAAAEAARNICRGRC